MRPSLIALGAIALAFAAPALAEGFAPGAWEHETDTVSADVPGFPQWLVKLFTGHQSRKSCFTPQQVSHPEALLTQDDAAVCKLRRISLGQGRLIFDTFCVNKRFPEGLLVSSQGSYTPESYRIQTVSTGTKGGKPVKIVTTGSGRRTGTCK